MSYFWVANFIGAFAAGMSNVYLTDRLGFGLVSLIHIVCIRNYADNQVTPLAAMLQFVAYFFASFAPPYPIFVSVFTLNGMGFGLQDALANVRVLCLSLSTSILAACLFSLSSFLPLLTREMSLAPLATLEVLVALI